ncbi:hypothetical protein [Nocardia sp. NPDC052566]|uniref:hypothetical protein n=1 Tax=Nocardia sp. NPDC052566 TaxID=3364330 RepID=UPI0037CA269A
MTSSEKALGQRLFELELWRDHRTRCDTVAMAQIHEQLAAIHSRISAIQESMGDREAAGSGDGTDLAQVVPIYRKPFGDN